MRIYGRNPVREALSAGRRAVREVWATEGAAREPWLRGLSVQAASADEIEARCGSAEHQGLCADCDPYPYVQVESLFESEAPTIVALDELQDPQNLGAIGRSAECAGATGVVICERRAAAITPAVCKASAGAVEHLRVARAGNLVEFLALAKQRGCWCYGARANGASPYWAPNYSGGVVLVLGAEGRGLRRLVSERCDELVALPLEGRVGSLNVGAAAAVLLYEVLRQKKVA